jgi:hypothetical protein
VSKRRRKIKGSASAAGGVSTGNGSRSVGDRGSLHKGECQSARDQEETVIDAGLISNYRRGPETMTTENGLQGDAEMTILTRA